MKQKPKTHTCRSRVLTDPEPEFVSLVKAGANMTPFRSVKAADPESTGETIMQVRKRTRSATKGSAATGLDNKLPHPLATKSAKAEGFMIARIEFAEGDQFPDEKAVKAWLDDGGYAEYDLSAVDGGWDVVSKSDAELEGKPELLSSGAGYAVYVGKLKTDGTEDEGADDAASSSASVENVNPVAKKSDEAETAEKSEDTQEDEGEGEATAETLTVNPFPAELAEKIDGAIKSRKSMFEVNEIGGLINDIRWIQTYGDLESESLEAVRNAAGWLIHALANVMDDTLEEFSAAFGAATQKAEEVEEAEKSEDTASETEAETVEAEEAAKTEDAGEASPEDSADKEEAEKSETSEEAAVEEEPSAEQPDHAAALTEAIKAAMAPVADALAEVTKTVTELGEQSKKTESRLTEIEEARAPTRKGVGADELEAGTQSKKEEDPPAGTRIQKTAFRSALGFSTNAD